MTSGTSVKLVRPDGSTYNYTPSHEPLAASCNERGSKPASPSPRLTSLWTLYALRSRSLIPCSTGTQHSPTANISGRLASAWPRRWTRRNVEWVWTWPLALELIQRSTAAAKTRGALVASGAGTDHLPMRTAAHSAGRDQCLSGPMRSH